MILPVLFVARRTSRGSLVQLLSFADAKFKIHVLGNKFRRSGIRVSPTAVPLFARGEKRMGMRKGWRRVIDRERERGCYTGDTVKISPTLSPVPGRNRLTEDVLFRRVAFLLHNVSFLFDGNGVGISRLSLEHRHSSPLLARHFTTLLSFLGILLRRFLGFLRTEDFLGSFRPANIEV